MILLLGPDSWVIRMRGMLNDSDAKIVTSRTAGGMRGAREHIETIVARNPEQWITKADSDAYTLATILNSNRGERMERNQIKSRTLRSSIRIDEELLIREDRHKLQDLLRHLVAREAGYMLETALKDTGVDQYSPLWVRFEGPQRDRYRYLTTLPIDLTYTPGYIPEPMQPSSAPEPDDWGNLRQRGELPMLKPALTRPDENGSI